MSSASTTIKFKMKDTKDAVAAAAIMRSIASQRKPEYPNELKKFIDAIEIDENTVRVEDSYSLMSSTFNEMIPQIMLGIAMRPIGKSTMKAWFMSFDCGYGSDFVGKISKSGEFTMSFNQHD